MGVDKYVLSVNDLKMHSDSPHNWGPVDLLRGLMSKEHFDATLHNPVTRKNEVLRDLVCFGSHEVRMRFFKSVTRFRIYNGSSFSDSIRPQTRNRIAH